MNIIVFVAFFDKRIKTPVTILLQGLAISDSLTAFCTYGLVPLFVHQFRDIGITNTDSNIQIGTPVGFGLGTQKNFTVSDITNLVNIKYPYCIIHYCATQLADSFHLVSVLLTASLGLQKLLAVAFPIRFRITITNRKSVVVCWICFLTSMMINIPRIFVVRLSSIEKDTCFVSKPNKLLEKYVLMFHPFLFLFLLVSAVVIMTISSFYIAFILCYQKGIRRNDSFPKCKTKRRSSILILCIVVVFLLSEIPRLLINITVFNTYKSDMNKEDIVWKKVKYEISDKSMKCLDRRQLRFVQKVNSDLNLNISMSCQSDIDSSNNYSVWTNYVVHTLVGNTYEDYIKQLSSKIDPEYEEMVTTIIQKLTGLMKSNTERSLTKLIDIILCNNISEVNFEKIKRSYEMAIYSCDISKIPPIHKHFSYLILGITPYSEPMNYILNIVWGKFDITLEKLKIIMEILKISTVVGCVSNFVIYFLMSEKLRRALKFSRNLPFLNYKKRIIAWELQRYKVSTKSISTDATETDTEFVLD
ncbi:unnamed protein product [Mytilus coruscus]|uniref:G-protein coupled receptors family 1 profile domain-containing protein n=1 Tax=Mytilus coruscus TaxID=42192 RepID=A0A6J8ATK2_MYTCO|nr:unnamed protein product [Mytilus coruscus]